MQEIPPLIGRMIWLLLAMYMMTCAVNYAEKGKWPACLFKLGYAILNVYLFLTVQ